MERFEHTTIEVCPIATLEEALNRMLLPASAQLPAEKAAAPSQAPVPVLAAEEQTAAGNG